MSKLLKSKKFWVSIGGVLAISLNTTLGIPEESINQVAGIIISYVLAQGMADLGKEAK